MIVDFRRLEALLTWLLLLVSPAIVDAQNPTALRSLRYRIDDRGQPREFEIATDEIHVGTPGKTGGRIEKVAALDRGTDSIRQRAKRIASENGTQAELVLYPADEPHSEAKRRILTRQILVRLTKASDADALAQRCGLIDHGAFMQGSDYRIFETKEAGGALEAALLLRKSPGVISAEPQLAHQQQKRWAPNDPLFAQQWHLNNTGQGGGLATTDVNIGPAWDSVRGAGVRIGIVDDGLQITHPDLSSAVDLVNDYDWNDATPDDPSPDLFYDFHGTSCAGVAAGRGGNGIGITGAAPESTLVGLRLISAPTIDSQEADAMTWKSDLIQVKSNSWGPSDDARTLEGPGSLTTLALEQAAMLGRGGLGTIFVWAGGNGGDVGDDSNYDGYANSIFTIAVGAIGNDGKRAYYSEPGANLVVSAPSSGGKLGIVTTDLVGNSGYNNSTVSGELSDRDYTNDFGGTSSAAPLTAGCIALMLEANPSLGWRDVQEILIRSARKVDPSHVDWITNAAGFHFNHHFGAGMIDTAAAVSMAKSWTALPPSSTLTSSQPGLSISIPDNNSTGITRSFDLTEANLRVEHVTVKVTIPHTSRGQLALTLTSPSGTHSRLAEKHADTGDNYTAWTFSTVRDWGEDAQGVWTLKICDLASTASGKLTDVTLTVHGTPAPPVNQPPVITGATISLSGLAFDDQTVAVQNVIASDKDGDAITLTYQWQRSTDNVTFTAIPEATGSTFAMAGLSGQLIRCQITPTAAGKAGAAFYTSTLAIDHRPPSFAQHGVPFSYDSDLILSTQAGAFSKPAILNEFSQGASGSKEWIELLVLKTADLRGYTLGDRGGTYVTFSQSNTWSAVAAGTLIVIYNANDRDTGLPTDDLDPAGGSMIIPNKNTTLFAGTSTWGGLTNSSPESIVLKNPDGQIVDALSLNSENVYDPKLGTVAAQKCAFYAGNTELGADDKAQWTIAAYTSATPGAGNGATNTQFLADLRSGALDSPPKFRLKSSGDLIPGLSIDADTGVWSGTPNVPDGGLFSVTIERFTNAEVVEQAFTLLVGTSDGTYTVPEGKTWSAGGDMTIAGSLIVRGRFDSAGHSIVIADFLSLASTGNLLNASGVITYRNLRGASYVPGASRLFVDAMNDLADPDGDRLSNLVEFAMGTGPGSPNGSTFVRTEIVNGHAVHTIRHPDGAGGVTRLIEVCGDLLTWRSGTGFTETVSDSLGPNGFREITVRDLETGPIRYVRVKVSR